MTSFAITRRNGDIYRVLLDAEDYERVLALGRWSVDVKSNRRPVYAVYTGGGGSPVLLHRFLLQAPQGMQVDHINGDGLDCRKENLRLCTASENRCNRGMQADNKSGYKGVCWHKQRGKWHAQIKRFGQKYSLGLYSTPEAAHAAYCSAGVEHHGAFARTA